MNKKVRSGAVRCKHVALAVTAAFLPSGQSYALPTGEAVVAGDVTVTRPTAQTMQINQATQKGIVNWLGFSIGASEHVNVTQPSASASLLNRVVGNNPSEIFGRLTANGRVFLVNPNGVLFAPGASVDVGSLFASSLALADQDFLAGRYQFSRQGSAGSVVNQGSIITANGYTALIGPQVRNDGVIIARSGAVALAAGDRVSLDMVGDGLISVSVDQAALNASVVNTGRIEADGGLVVLAARSANALLDTVINTSGIVRANSLVERNGEIVLQGGDAGVVAVSGSLQAAGGTIELSGDKIGVLDGARIDVSADTGGGSVHTNAAALYVAPNASISADALQSGNGGRVILWSSDSTQIHGAVSALGAGEGAGGFVETSGGFLDVTRAPDVGAGGTWLIDPFNITVVGGVGTVNNGGAPSFTPTGDDSQIAVGLINGQLDAGGNVVLDTGGPGSSGAQDGDITVNAAIIKNAANAASLSLNAARDVTANASILLGIGTGSLNVTAGRDFTVNNASVTGAGMTVNAAGAVRVLATAPGTSASLNAGSNQTITSAAVEARASAGAVTATITNNGGTQTINTGTITLANSPLGGNNSFAGLLAGRQRITATGDVTLTGGGSAGTSQGVRIGGGTGSATDLELGVRNLTLNGGSVTGNGAAIGSSGTAAVASPNTIMITASESVNLNAGTASDTGVRIGYGGNGPAGGNISIKAGTTIELGTLAPGGTTRNAAIRTSGNVTLEAASVNLKSNGSITGGPVSVTTSSLTNAGTISNGGGTNTGNVVLSANAFNLVGGNVQGGAAAVILRPRDGTRSFGVEAAGNPTLANHTNITNADIASISTSNFIVFGSGMGTTFTGDMTIGQDAQVNGGAKHLAFFRSASPGGTTTIGSQGVATTGDVIVSAGGGAIVSNGIGIVAGDEVQLRASQGIGTPFGQWVRTAANALAVNNTGPQGAYVLENDNVTLRTIALTVGGPPNAIPNVVGNAVGGTFELTSIGGSVDIAGVVSTGTMSIGAPSGSISESAGGAILANTLNTNSAGATILSGPNQISNFSAFSNGALSLTNSGALTVNSFFAMLGNGTLTNAGDVSVTGAWNSQAAKIDTTGNLTVTGSVSSNGFMEVDVDGTLTVAASGQIPPSVPGLPSTPRMASLSSGGGQDIDAGGIKVVASDGAFATIGNNGTPSTIDIPAQKIVVGGGGIELRSTGAVLPSDPHSSAQISNFSNGNQEITVAGGGINVISTAGNASITTSGPFLFPPPPFPGDPTLPPPPPPPPPASQTPGSQTITVTGGSGIDLFANGGSATITQNAQGGAQSITTIDADHIALDGRAGLASISSFQGEQTISMTGIGNNALRLGSAGGQGLSQMLGRTQSITAGDATRGEAGRIDLVGASAPSSFVGITTSNAPGAGNSQTVSTAGAITIQGGNAAFQNPAPPPANITSSFTGITHNSNGQQTINAASLELQGGAGINNGVGISSNQGARQQVAARAITLKGGPSGTNNTAFLSSNSGGDQTVIATAGSITITGGDGGTVNRAGIVTNARQTISGNPDIVLTGGGAGNGNNVFVQSTFIESPGGETKPQTINARSIQLISGAGVDASATLNAARQVITTTGNVSLFGGAGLGSTNGVRIGGSGGTTLGPTNLTLSVGGDLLLHGGTANGAGLGSSGPSMQANTIAVTAGNITLESEGADARIGTSRQVQVTPGNISVTAAGNLQLGEGTAIRANGPITLTATSLVNDGTITNGGGSDSMLLSANSYDLAGGIVQGGSAAVLLRPRDGTRSFGIEAAGDPTLTHHTNITNADLASISTSNFIVFGSGTGTNFTGNMTIGQDAQVNGGAKNLAFFRSTSPGGTTTIGSQGVTTTGDVIVSAGGGAIVSNGTGIVAGDEVQLRATQSIGESGARVHTAASALTVGTSADAFVTEANDVTLRTIALNVGGNTALNTTTTSTGGVLDLIVNGDLNVAGSVTSARSMDISAVGALNVTGAGTQDGILSSTGGQTITAQSVNLSAQDGRRARIENIGGDQSVTAGAGGMNLEVVAAQGVAQIVNLGAGSQTISASGALSVSGGAISPTVRNSGLFNGSGMQTVSAASISLHGGSSGTSAGAFISSQGSQLIDVSGDISLLGGNGGTNNHAQINAGAAGTQTIYAHDISLSNGVGGNDIVAVITGGHQTIDVTGTVTLSADGAIASGVPGSTGVRIGAPGGGNPTDLKLFVDGDLILNGGNVANNGVGIGSSSAGAAEANVIEIEVGRSLILNGGSHHGTNARIGSSAQNGLADGIITIKAGSIELNGGSIQPGVENSAAIRTQGSVTLHAGTISESGNGLIIAETLTTTTTSGGATTLTGPNAIQRYSATSAGDLNLNNTVALEILSLTAPNATVTNAGSMTVSGFWNSTAASSITTTGPGSDLMITGTVTSNGAMNVIADGTLTVAASGQQPPASPELPPIPQFASLTSFAGQNITAKSMLVSAQDGGAATITNHAGDQAITISSGGIDVRSSGSVPSSFAEIFSNGPQAITVVGPGGVNLSSTGGLASITSNSSVQVIDVTAGALTLAASGMQIDPPPPGSPPGPFANGASLISFGGQNISANSVRISAEDGRTAQINNIGSGNQILTVGGGGVDIRSSGGLASGPFISTARISNFTPGSQTITASGAGGVNLSSSRGFALIDSNGGQVITVTAGTGLDLNAEGGNSLILGASQTITAKDADHINLNGMSGSAVISSTGEQTLSIKGTGANAITFGSVGAIGSSQMIGGANQKVTAGEGGEQGSITIIGSSRNGAGASIVSQAAPGGTQTVSTTGLLSITGGDAAAQNNAPGIFHNGSGLQNISAAGLELRGGTSGNGNGAIIGSNGGGNLANAGDQRLDISGDLVIAAGNGGDALINGGGLGKRQTIYARNIEMSNGTGGTNSFAAIRGGSQEIHASGDVRLTARSTAGADGGVRIGSRTPNPADVKLFVGRDLVLTGGSRADNNANIGSSGASGAVSNTIYIEAGGNVILNSGTGAGARIGTGVPVGTGSIEVHAGGDIQLNGVDQVTAIRAGTVTLSAASISEGSKGLIVADTLNTTTRGDALLTGPNQVSSFTAASESGNVSLTNTSGLLTLGSMNLPGTLSVIQTGDVAIGAANAQNATFVYASGDISVDASGAIVVRGSDTTAGAAGAVVSDGTLDFNAGNVSLIGGGALAAPVLVRGDLVEMQLAGRLNVTGGSGHLSPAVLSSGSDFNLEIGDSVRVTAGSGLLSLARIQTEIKDGVINIHFPELSAGGYFVNGVEGREHHGQTGFFTLHKPAKEGGSLLLTYGD